MTTEEKTKLFKLFKTLGAEGITLNHYELAEITQIGNAQLWKEFLTDSDVATYIKEESDILLQTELRKLSNNASQSHSVGQAQLLNALGKISEDTQTVDGPIFIYTYVPLTLNQEKAENVRKEDHDIFLKEIETDPKETEIEINAREIEDDDEF